MQFVLDDPIVQRLYALVLSRQQLADDVRSELDAWDSAVERGAPPPELRDWAARIATRIEATPGQACHAVVV